MTTLEHDRPAPGSRKGANLDGPRPLLYFVHSPTSGPSRRAEGFLAQVLQRRQNHNAFVLKRINCVERPDLAEKLGVTDVPALVVVEGRSVRARLEGLGGCRAIERMLEPWLRSADGEVADADAAPWCERGAKRDPGPLATALDDDSRGLFARTTIGLPPGLAFDRWRLIGRNICGVADASTWWLADWAAYGEDRYGERCQEAAAITGVAGQTLRNYAWVSRRFDVSRRRDRLSFAHHSEVAALPEEEQEVWLDRAEAGRWCRNELRTALREARAADGGSTVERLRLEVPSVHVRCWRTAAEARGLTLSDWIIAVADHASSG